MEIINKENKVVETTSAPTTYDMELKSKKKKKEYTFEEKLSKFMYESKQIQFGLKRRVEVKLAGGKKKYAKKHARKKK